MIIPGMRVKVTTNGLPRYGEIGIVIVGPAVTVKFSDGAEHSYGSNHLTKIN